MKPIERRFCTTSPHAGLRIEKRSDGTPTKIVGYGAVFYNPAALGTEYEFTSGAVERIMPGAFDRVLRSSPDVRGLFNHDANYPLGRTVSGSLRLSVDNTGLRYEIDINPASQTARDVAAAVQRGDVAGSSFSFMIGKDKWTEAGTRTVRQIIEIGSLLDVSPVTWPAYGAATAVTRQVSAQALRAHYLTRALAISAYP